MNYMSFQEIYAAIGILGTLITAGKFIYTKRASLKEAAIRLHNWGHTPITITSSTGMVAYLRYTPAALIKTCVRFHVWVMRVIYHVYIMLLSAQIIFIGHNEKSIQLAIGFFAFGFILGEVMFWLFRDKELHK